MNAIVYKITCLTNLHVGSGKANFDIIDNTVEKDPVTELPTINSSGVKGALRQHFLEHGVEAEDIKNIFGSSKKESSETGTAPGQVKFYQADLLARPARASKGTRAYYLVTFDMAIEQFKMKMNVFADGDNTETKSRDEVEVEGIASVIGIELAGNDLVVLGDADLKSLPLPVLARNQLEDGVSRNLWYEEVVPHKSIFIFAVSSENSDILKKIAKFIEQNPYVQFGGNASIGYGLCKVEKIGRNGVS